MAVNQYKTMGHQRGCILGDENLNQTGIPNNPLKVSMASGLSAFGEYIVAQPHPIFQYSFEYTVDNTDLTENEVVNGGTVTQDSGMAIVSTSTVTGSSATLKAIRHAKYRAGQGGLCRFTAKFPNGGIADTEQYIGLVTESGVTAAFTDGYMVGFDGVNFGIHRFQNDVKFSINLENCDDPLDGSGLSGMVYDPTKLNVFGIQFQYLGGGAVIFSIEDDSTGMFVKFHTILYANNFTVPSVYNPNFHFLMFVNNGSTTVNIQMSSASCAYFIEGATKNIQTHQPQNSSGSISKTGVTTSRALLTIRNKTTYASKTNFIDILLEQLVCSIESSSANNLGTISLVRDATLGGTPSYTDINTTNSVIEYDVAATTVTGGKELLVIPLAGKNDKEIINLLDFDIVLRSGQAVTVTGSSSNAAEIRAALLWKEEF